MIESGQRRHRISIERNTPVKSARGDLEDDWNQISSRMAALEYVTGREFYANQQVQSEATVRFGLLYDSSLQIDRKLDRVKFGARIFNIVDDVNVDFANREIWLMCKELR